MILVIDNFDSFVHNLARYLRNLGQDVVVLRNDAVTPGDIERLAPQAIILSPGPCTPDASGCCLEVVRRFEMRVPMLGVCLGHQIIAQALGAKIRRVARPIHGRASWVKHDGRGIFHLAPNPLAAARYHSLVVEEASLPECLEASAWCDGLLMGFRHRNFPLVGVQFHPESILTEHGYLLLANFLRHVVGIPTPPPPRFEQERAPHRPAPPAPSSPVTF